MPKYISICLLNNLLIKNNNNICVNNFEYTYLTLRTYFSVNTYSGSYVYTHVYGIYVYSEVHPLKKVLRMLFE